MARLYTVTDVVNQMIGSIKPFGDESIDEERLANLRNQGELIHDLVTDMVGNLTYQGRHEMSIKQNVYDTENYLRGLRDVLDEVLDEEE